MPLTELEGLARVIAETLTDRVGEPVTIRDTTIARAILASPVIAKIERDAERRVVEFFAETKVMARKEYRCDSCNTLIPSREEHSYMRMKTAAQPPASEKPAIIVLVNADDPDAKPMLYACGKCGSVHSPATYMATVEVAHRTAREAAENCYNCRTHDICDTCECETPKGWTRCNACRFKARLDTATEVPDDGGPYCAFDGDEYYTDMEQASDAGLEWVSPCDIVYPRIDPDNIIDSLLSDMHEDASVDDLDGVDELYAAVKAFNEAQRGQTWFGDNKRKIRVPLLTERNHDA